MPDHCDELVIQMTQQNVPCLQPQLNYVYSWYAICRLNNTQIGHSFYSTSLLMQDYVSQYSYKMDSLACVNGKLDDIVKQYINNQL